MNYIPPFRQIVIEQPLSILNYSILDLHCEIAHTFQTPEKEMAKVVIVTVDHVYVDRSLAEDKEIVFQAGTHSDAIRMRYMAFSALGFPVTAEFHRSPSKVW
jgi:hypothetical protein